jgi:hypothetical protein
MSAIFKMAAKTRHKNTSSCFAERKKNNNNKNNNKKQIKNNKSPKLCLGDLIKN